MMHCVGAGIRGISYYLPEKELRNSDLEFLYQNWPADKILSKTGIESRHVADAQECVSDMAIKAAEALFFEYPISADEIDFVILVTQCPDYIMPYTACVIQDRLCLPKSTGALDINLGCSGFVYGLALSKGLIHTGIAENVLLITADMLTKYIHPFDRSFRAIIGDAAAVTWVSECDTEQIHSFSLGTDGSGIDKLIIPAGGHRLPRTPETKKECFDGSGNVRTQENLFMDGPGVFNFTIDVVPDLVRDVLERNHLTDSDIDLYVFHQANQYMLEFLKECIGIPDEKFYISMRDIGNTSSATIPIALLRAEQEGRLQHGDRALLVGFGIGLSWAAVVINY